MFSEQKFDLGWGEATVVRQAFSTTYTGPAMVIDNEKIASMGYSDHYGCPKLIQTTREVIKRQIGKEYRHVVLTHGAAGAIVSLLTALRQQGNTTCTTSIPPYFYQYPQMISAAGMFHLPVHPGTKMEGFIHQVALVDSPSNPKGEFVKALPPGQTVILDGVYNNLVYCHPFDQEVMKHDILIGSYSKLLGLNGVRIGWVALDDTLLYERLKLVVSAAYCSLSRLSMDFLTMALSDFNWDMFEIKAQGYLNDNRTEWQKLERFFGGERVPENGMFFYGQMDPHAQLIFENAGIIGTKGSVIGATDEFMRFNLGADRRIVSLAVNRILTRDGMRRSLGNL